MSGTSMAAPHVTGVVALMLAVNPNLKYADVVSIFQTTSRAYPAGSNCLADGCGYGMVDAYAAVHAAQLSSPGATATATAVPSRTNTATATTLPSKTNTATITKTSTATAVKTSTATAVKTSTATAFKSSTPTQTKTVTSTATATKTAVPPTYPKPYLLGLIAGLDPARPNQVILVGLNFVSGVTKVSIAGSAVITNGTVINPNMLQFAWPAALTGTRIPLRVYNTSLAVDGSGTLYVDVVNSSVKSVPTATPASGGNCNQTNAYPGPDPYPGPDTPPFSGSACTVYLPIVLNHAGQPLPTPTATPTATPTPLPTATPTSDAYPAP